MKVISIVQFIKLKASYSISSSFVVKIFAVVKREFILVNDKKKKKA